MSEAQSVERRYPDLVATLMAMAGNDNVVVVHRSFVQFTGSLEAGMMLSQLLYWTPRARDGWVAKSDKDFCDELCLSRYAVRQARALLEKMGFLETRVGKWNGAPTVHYRLDLEVLQARWSEWIRTINTPPIVQNRTMNCAISDNGLSEIAQSITEITTEITTERDCNDADASLQFAEAKENPPRRKTTHHPPDAPSAPPKTKDFSCPANSCPNPRATVEFDTPEARVLQASLRASAAAKGRRGPQRFPTLEVKRRFLAAVDRLGTHWPAAMREGLARGISDISRLVAWIDRWQPPSTPSDYGAPPVFLQRIIGNYTTPEMRDAFSDVLEALGDEAEKVVQAALQRGIRYPGPMLSWLIGCARYRRGESESEALEIEPRLGDMESVIRRVAAEMGITEEQQRAADEARRAYLSQKRRENERILSREV